MFVVNLSDIILTSNINKQINKVKYNFLVDILISMVYIIAIIKPTQEYEFFIFEI